MTCDGAKRFIEAFRMREEQHITVHEQYLRRPLTLASAL